MNKKTFLTGLGVLIALTAVGSPLTPDQALQRARQSGGARVVSKAPVAEMQLVYSAKAASGTPAAYVFNNPTAGYVIVGADDVAYPILGYSDEGRIDAENLSPELKWWLEEYGRQIEWAVSNGVKAATGESPAGAESDWAPIPAMVKTKWDQTEPYYNQCPKPTGGSQPCVTGCVATSMAQVMKYHNYPQHGEGIVSYSTTIEGANRKLTINLAQKDFDWENMLNLYKKGNYSDTEADAVAYLMKACGFTVNMQYSTTMSGTTGASIAPALKKYFNYDEGVASVQRDLYSSSQWREMMYNNLKNIGPVVINGQASDGGHSFVCDGYDGKGYFHINWGWSGTSDGFYSLDALNPEAQGTGSYTGGYNSRQNAIFGIQPPTGNPVTPEPKRILQYGSTTASVNGSVMTFDVTGGTMLGWTTTADKLRAKIGAIYEPVDGTSGSRVDVEGTLGVLDVVELDYVGQYYGNDRVLPLVAIPQLPDGNYKVTLACYDMDFEGAEWVPVAVAWGNRNYCMLKVEGSRHTVTNVPMATISMSDASFGSKLYAGKNVLVKAKFTNDSDLELVQGLSPRLCNAAGYKVFEGESVLISLDAGVTEEREWLTRFYDSRGMSASVSKETGYKLKFYDSKTDTYFPGIEVDVTMYPSPGTTRTMLTGMKIDNAEEVIEMTVNDRHLPYVAQISDLNDIKASYSFKVQSGYFDGMVTAGISQMDPDDPYDLIPVVDEFYKVMPFTENGETFSDVVTASFPEAEPGEVYFIHFRQTLGSTQSNMGSLPFIMAGSGVGDIEGNDAVEEYYNMLGVRIGDPVKGQPVIVKKGSKVSKRIWK